MPERRRGYKLCTCTKCRQDDPNGVGCVLSAEDVKIHQAKESMGFYNKPKAPRRAGADHPSIQEGPPEPDPTSAQAREVADPLVVAFTDRPGGPDAFLAHKLSSMTLDVPPSSKKGRSALCLNERALKVLHCAREETFALQEQLLEKIESEQGLSLEFLVRVETRLGTLGLAVEKTNRQEPEIVSLKKLVLENLETLQGKCDAQRAALPHLRDAGPVKFSSGKLTLFSNSNNELTICVF